MEAAKVVDKTALPQSYGLNDEMFLGDRVSIEEIPFQVLLLISNGEGKV